MIGDIIISYMREGAKMNAFKNIAHYLKDNRKAMLIILFVAALITATGIIFGQSFFKILPLYISLFIGFLNSRINRYAPLIGGFNSLLYAAVNFSYKLYGNAIYAALFSSTLQFITFYRWSRHPVGESTRLKKMTNKQRIIAIILCIVVYAALYIFLKTVNGSYSMLDASTSLLGIIITVLMMLSFAEYTWLNIPSQIISLVMYSVMIKDHNEMITYLIYTVYILVCCILAAITAKRLLKEQEN